MRICPVPRACRGLVAAVVAAASVLGIACTGPSIDFPDSSVPAEAVFMNQSSTAGDRIKAKPSLRFSSKTDPGDRPVFAIDDSVRYQTIDGFGAAFLEAGLTTLNTLPSRSQQDAVLRALFDVQSGAGFSAMKTPIGGTDFQSASPNWYTYDDTPRDTALKHFSIARDLRQNGLITYIRRARQAGGSFVLQAPMDYPPDWMLNDVKTDQNVNSRYYQTLADYYVRYVQEYEKHGIHVDFISPFNEPGNYTKVTFADIRSIIRDYVGPTFQRQHLTTRIQLSESGGRSAAAVDYPTVLDDQGARKYVATLPYHGYEDGGYSEVAGLHSKYPDIPLWMTEVCCLFDQNTGLSFESGDTWANVIISDLEAGASAWIYWNAILNEGGGPWLVSPTHEDPDGNAQESIVVIDRQSHTVSYTGLYYYLAHFSKFVRPGARRIQTTASAPQGLRAISFRNADGSLVAELLNSNAEPVEVQLDWHDRSLSLPLPGNSITTLQWR